MNKINYEKYFNTFMNREATKEVTFENLTKDEKINYLSQFTSTDGIKISSTKEIDIVNLSKDKKFELITKAAKEGNLDLITRLSTNDGKIVVDIITDFEAATQSAKLNYLQKQYLSTHENLPEKVTLENLGGENFKEFIKFAYAKIMNEESK